MPDFHISAFRRNAHSLPDINLTAILENLAPPKTIYYSIDLLTNQQAFIVIETELLPESGTLVQFCGDFNYDPEITPYAFFYAEQVFAQEP
ncbi:MAG: hypothetical protein HYU84_00530 [Chloroflexi bacterium]|nr:hypothetical protein [Chloroflexota bacterium]